ncbi:LCP family protein [Lachnospiraceae bacterium 56-18]|uniref:LCP family protein n=1 Tax=Sporofaciens sp. JLR.KK001 TaxID=3112621 RepID=UPI002FF2DFD7
MRHIGIIGKFIILLQLLMSAWLVISLWSTGMIPMKMLAVIVGIVFVLLIAAYVMQVSDSLGTNLLGMILSVLFMAVAAKGATIFMSANSMLANVGGATYKIDNMLVVVRIDDPAENLMDAKDYVFGRQTYADQENTEKMLSEIRSRVGQEISLLEYDTVQSEAAALLNGEIQAAVYNEAFTGVLEESIEGYSERVKVLDHFEIRTKVDTAGRSVNKPFNVYISGIDVSGAITTTSRSDVNIIMNVNPDTKKILLTTTPRDYYVTIPGISGERRDKLTHAGIYGVDRSMAALENLYGVELSYYAKVNFTSLIKIVDALGGVDVESEYAFSAGGYSFSEGINHLDGDAALAFSRERYSFSDGDNQRGKNQEAVLAAIIKKASSPAVLASANKILASISKSVETNMTQDEMAQLISMQLSDGGDWDVESQAASGKGDTQTCFSSGSQPLYVMWPDDAAVAELSEKMRLVLEGK